MTNNKRILIVAVILGLVTVIALNYYIRSLDTPAMATVPHTDVVVAENTIPEHTRITSEMLGTESIPADAVHPEAITSMDQAVGGISRSEIIRGEQVLTNRVVTEDRRATLSYRVPEGMRAISIPVGEVIGVAGYIAPGDKVDVLISYSIGPEGEEAEEETGDELTTYTVFQNVKVLATGGLTRAKDDEEREVVGTVTVAVEPTQAEVLAYANLQGSFHLTLRSPIDEDLDEEVDYYNRDVFETYKER